MGSHRRSAARAALESLCAQDLTYGELQDASAAVMRRAAPYEVAVHSTIDPATMIETSCRPVGIPHSPERERALLELEYTAGDPLTYVEVARRPRPAAALAAEVDDLTTVRRHAELLGRFGVTDELRGAFVADGWCWGTATLYRAGGDRFDPDEIDWFAGISDVVARGLRRCFLRAAAETADDGDGDEGPGHCIVGRDGELLVTTRAAERWLDSLQVPGPGLPAALRSVIARLDVSVESSATVVGDAGPLVVHATSAKGTDDACSVVIERPQPPRLAPLLMAAHGLTEREREVTTEVLRGRTTRQIARTLEIGDYTVQDHLKSVFTKVGVGTRGELAWTLCLRHYLPRVHAGATPSPYGWFLED